MTRDEIIRMALKAGCDSLNIPGVGIILRYNNTRVTNLLEQFAALVAAAEREECAKVCEQRKIITPEWQLDQHYNQGASHCAAAIRARSEKGQS